MKLPLCHGQRLLPVLLYFRSHLAANADRRIRGDGNDGNLKRLPARCYVAGAGILSVAAGYSAFHEFPELNTVSDGNALERSALYLLKNRFRVFVAVKLNNRFPSAVLNPGAFDPAQNFVAMVVVKQYADFVQAGKVYGTGAVV